MEEEEEEGDTHCSGGHMSTGSIGAWNSYFHRINWMDRNTAWGHGGLGEGEMIIGSDPCKLLAELLSPCRRWRVRGQGSSVGRLRCQ